MSSNSRILTRSVGLIFAPESHHVLTRLWCENEPNWLENVDFQRVDMSQNFSTSRKEAKLMAKKCND